MIKVNTNDEARAVLSFRARPEAKFLRKIIERELAAARERFETTTASNELRLEVDAHKALLNKFFDDEVVLERT